RANDVGLQPVVFVHGLWLLPNSWERWAAFFESVGYVAVVPGWPDDPETVADANVHAQDLADKTIKQIADYEERIVRRLNRKPALVGHSFGGLIVQILAGRGLCGDRRDFARAVPRRAAAAGVVDQVGLAGVQQSGESPARGSTFVRAVRVRFCERGQPARGAATVRELRGARP